MRSRYLLAALMFLLACRSHEPGASPPPASAPAYSVAPARVVPPGPAPAPARPVLPVPADAGPRPAAPANAARQQDADALRTSAEAQHMADLLSGSGTSGVLSRHDGRPIDAGARRPGDGVVETVLGHRPGTSSTATHGEPRIGTVRGPGKH